MPELQEVKHDRLISQEELNDYKELPNNKALAILTIELEVAFCNNTFKRLFNIDIGENLDSLIPNSDFLSLLKGFREKKFRNLTSDILLSLPGKYESSLYQVGIDRILISQKQFFFVIVESLEQRKTIERKINEFHIALDKGNIPVIIMDQNKKIIYATRSFEDVFGMSMENMYNLNITDLLREHLSFDEHDHLALALEKNISWKRVVPIVKMNREEYWEFSLHPFLAEEQSLPSFMLSASNLTEHIFHKKIIETSEKKQKLILENISDLLLILKYSDSKIRFENANDNFCKIFNLTKNNLHLVPIYELLPVELVKHITMAVNDIEQSKCVLYDFDYRHSGDLRFSCKVTCTFENGSDNRIFIISMKDVTEETLYREQLEKAYIKEMQLNKMKSDFLANISHEIRTPFNGITGYSDIIDECIADGDYHTIKELIDSMKEVLGRTLNLFNNLVEVSHIEAGELEIEKIDMNCNQILRNVYEKRFNDALKKNIEFKIALNEHDCYIETDWIKFEKIIDVLVDNAIKYTEEGFILINSEIIDNYIVIKISDSGIGIEEAQIARILKPFSQEIEGYTRPYEGVGLGLTIAYKLTELLGGKFEIISIKNKGTEVMLKFPKSEYTNNRNI